MVSGGCVMNKKALIVFLIMALVVTGAITFYIIDKRVPMSPSNSGNTPGNLQNGGLFFEMDGKVYFSNSNDANCLYSMNPDESSPKRLTSMGAKYISGAEDFLYFYMDSTKVSSKVTGLGSVTNQYGIYRCRTTGRDQFCLLRDFCGEVNLCGEYIYYQSKTGASLNKIKCNQKDQQQVSEDYISPVCYDDGLIFFTGVSKDHNIHTMDTRAGDLDSTVVSGNYFLPVVQDGYLYYLDGETNYSLWRVNLSTNEKTLVTSDRIDCFNVNSTHIYYAYSNAEAPSLRRCELDGNNREILYNGVVNSINLTSQYVYFKEFGNDDIIYHIPLNGSAPAQPFIISSK